MAREIECKYRVSQPAEFRRRVEQQCGAALHAVQEDNLILDTPAGTLQQRDSALRIRTTRPLAPAHAAQPDVTLTFKGPREQGGKADGAAAAAGIKAREELEITTVDAAGLQLILERLGYRPVVRFEKRRTTWRCGPCLVMLDELPQLGWFAEIEGPDAAAVHAAQLALALEASAVVDETYVELAARFGRVGAAGLRALIFDA